MVPGMAASFKVGDRIRATTTRYPIPAGAIGRVLEVNSYPLVGMTVEWEKPEENLSPLVTSTVWPWYYEHFEIIPDSTE